MSYKLVLPWLLSACAAVPLGVPAERRADDRAGLIELEQVIGAFLGGQLALAESAFVGTDRLTVFVASTAGLGPAVSGGSTTVVEFRLLQVPGRCLLEQVPGGQRWELHELVCQPAAGAAGQVLNP